MPVLPLPYWRLSAYYFCYFAFIGAFMPFFGLYLKSLGFSAFDIGLLVSMMQLMRLLGPYCWGALADRLGERVRIVRLTALATLIIFFGFYAAQGFAAIFTVLALHSFFWVAALPLVETLTFEHLREQAARYSRIRMWGSIGFIAAVAGTGAVLDRLPVDRLLWVCSAVLATILLTALFIPEAPRRTAVGSASPIGAILGERRVRALFAACFVMTAAHGAFNVFYSIFLAEHGYSKSLVGGLWSLGVVAEITVFFFMSSLLRRYSLRLIMIVCFAAAVVRFATIGWGIDSLTALVLAQLLHGLTFGAFHSAAIAAVNRWFAGAARSRGQALYASVSFGAGGLFGGLVSGLTWDTLGGSASFALGSVYAAVGLALVARFVRDDNGGQKPISADSSAAL